MDFLILIKPITLLEINDNLYYKNRKIYISERRDIICYSLKYNLEILKLIHL